MVLSDIQHRIVGAKSTKSLVFISQQTREFAINKSTKPLVFISQQNRRVFSLTEAWESTLVTTAYPF